MAWRLVMSRCGPVIRAMGGCNAVLPYPSLSLLINEMRKGEGGLRSATS
jgi:hypothetical protein